MFQYYSWIIVQTTDTHPASFATGPCLISPEGVNERNDSNKTAKADFVHVLWQQHQNCHLVKRDIQTPTVIRHIPISGMLWGENNAHLTRNKAAFSFPLHFLSPITSHQHLLSFSLVLILLSCLPFRQSSQLLSHSSVDSGEAWLLPNDA